MGTQQSTDEPSQVAMSSGNNNITIITQYNILDFLFLFLFYNNNSHKSSTFSHSRTEKQSWLYGKPACFPDQSDRISHKTGKQKEYVYDKSCKAKRLTFAHSTLAFTHSNGAQI